MEFAEVNYFAVGLAAVLAFALGMLWYSPLLFANAWMEGHGHTEENMERMRAGLAPTLALSFLCWFVMAAILAVVASHFGEGIGATLHVGVLLWLGFSATVGLTNNRCTGKPLRLWAIDAVYQLESIALMAIVLGLWP